MFRGKIITLSDVFSEVEKPSLLTLSIRVIVLLQPLLSHS